MTGFYLSLFLSSLGFLYLLSPFRQLDKRGFLYLHHALGTFPGERFFREVWIFGKTPLTLSFLVLFLIIEPNRGLPAVVIFSLAVTFERFLKLSLKRPRPFLALEDARMLQPTRPTDPSFPSGDCLRVWFLIIILLQVLPANWIAQLILYLLGTAVTLGRITLGVHYPSDTISGTGLGLLAGHLTLLTWHVFPAFTETVIKTVIFGG